MADKVKVFFVQETSEGEYETESLWCLKSREHFILDNIPFIAKRIALGDLIKAEYDEEDGAYYFDEFKEVSGNTTLRMYFNKIELIESVRKRLEEFGCATEAFLARKLIAVNVPKNIEYMSVKQYLEEGERLGEWQYEESCLSHTLT
jgi:hypothetical protein